MGLSALMGLRVLMGLRALMGLLALMGLRPLGYLFARKILLVGCYWMQIHHYSRSFDIFKRIWQPFLNRQKYKQNK
jgi:hypothetical protein